MCVAGHFDGGDGRSQVCGLLYIQSSFLMLVYNLYIQILYALKRFQFFGGKIEAA